jgi:hypothetical protein
MLEPSQQQTNDDTQDGEISGETIFWVDATQQLPDDEIAVLLLHPSLTEPVWLGYFFQNAWFTTQGDQLPHNAVTHWADVPCGPVHARG